MKVDTSIVDPISLEPVFISLDEAGLEESSDHDPLHGVYRNNEGSIYSYVAWFYDDDESAFSVM